MNKEVLQGTKKTVIQERNNLEVWIYNLTKHPVTTKPIRPILKVPGSAAATCVMRFRSPWLGFLATLRSRWSMSGTPRNSRRPKLSALLEFPSRNRISSCRRVVLAHTGWTPAVHTFESPQAMELAQAHHAKAITRLNKIATLSLAHEQQGLLVSSAVMSSLSYAAWGWEWSERQWAACRASVIRAFQGGRNPKSRASRENHRGHRLEPAACLADQAVRWLAWWWQMAPDITMLLVEAGAHKDRGGILATLS